MLHDYDAAAHLKGSAAYPDISGIVGFKAVRNGTWVAVQVSGLPDRTAKIADEATVIGKQGSATFYKR